MKALYILDQREGGLVLYGHDMEDRLVETLVDEYQGQGKHAYAVDQAGLHGGSAEICEKCRRAGEKISSGTLLFARSFQNREAISPLEGGIGMVSAELELPSRTLPDLVPAIRKFFSLLPLLGALVLIGFGLVYFMGPDSAPYIDGPDIQVGAVLPLSSPTLSVQAAIDTPAPTSTSVSLPTVTLQPTASPEPVVAVQSTITEAPACVDALSVTTEYLGRTICVTGTVYRAEQKEGVFSITFSKDWGNFYLLSYDLVWAEAQRGACIQVNGEIVLSGTIPVIVFGYRNDLSLCP
jgi:hypothetical protein